MLNLKIANRGMSVIKSNMAATAVYYTKFLCMVTPTFYDCNPCVCEWNSYIQNISKINLREHILIKKKYYTSGVLPYK